MKGRKLPERNSQTYLESLQEDGLYFDQKSDGLFLRKRGKYSSWVFRRYLKGKRYDLGIGGLRKVSLIQARKEAARLNLLSDSEFIASLEKKKEDKTPPEINLSFSDVASQYEEWNLEVGNWQELDKAHRVYLSRMKNHVLPVLGDLKFKEITCEDVARIAVRCWDKPETVQRVIQLTKRIFDWAKAKSLYSHDNPADRTGALKYLLPTERYAPTNRGAISVQDLPLFMKELHEHFKDSNARRCAFFAVLTATRSQTAREAKWSQIDLDKRVWDIPPSQLKMKSNGGLVVPLADEVIEFLKTLRREEGQELIFPNRYGRLMTDTMFSNVVADLPTKWLDEEQGRLLEHEVRATMHGIARATFRTWAQDDRLGNDKKFDARTAELCLHHKVQDAYNGAYERNKSFIRRREMMSAWAEYCFSLISPK